MNLILSPLSVVGALLYAPKQEPEILLRRFAAGLKERGFRLGGVLQETERLEDGCKCAMMVEEIDTGIRLNLSQSLGAASQSCVLDPQALAEASGALRRGLDGHFDLVLINKFGKAEQNGRGFAQELLALMAAKVPVLCPVPAQFLAQWQDFTGGIGALLPMDEAALWRWWGPEHLWQDLVNGVAVAPIKDIVWGQKFVMVVGPDGAGLAQWPNAEQGNADQAKAGQDLANAQIPSDLSQLARWVGDADPYRAALGLAAINAHYNRFDLVGPQGDGLTALSAKGRDVAVVGAFPGLAEKLDNPYILERKSINGTWPEDQAPWVIPRVDAVVMTASTLINKSAAKYLRLAQGKEVAMVGPSTPLTPRLHSYGCTILGGLVITDLSGAAQALRSGMGGKALKQFGRTLVMRSV